jgi:ketosteroid isomerase-like protein
MAAVSSSAENAVLAANRSFYEAFTGRDAEAMERLWAREHAVACTHPGRAALHGRDAVLSSWRAIVGSPDAPTVRFTAAAAVVLDDAAFVTCVEQVGDSRTAATNVFVLEQGEWKMVHHHAGLMPPDREPRRPKPSALN